MKNKPYDGFFISLEGGEGAGKTSLAEKIKTEFEKKGFQVVFTREPGGNPFSEKIRELLLKKQSEFSLCDKAELLLFLASRAQNLEEVILPALHQGKIVLCDRFNDSTIAYQGCARHLGMSYVETICNQVCQGIEPDCTLFLDLDPEIGLERLTHLRKKSVDRLEEEHLQFHKEVRQGFLHLADKYPERIKIVNAAQPLEQVFEESMNSLQPFLVNCKCIKT